MMVGVAGAIKESKERSKHGYDGGCVVMHKARKERASVRASLERILSVFTAFDGTNDVE
jgi:hypothetical protein